MFKDNSIETSSSIDINEFLTNAMFPVNNDRNELKDNDVNRANFQAPPVDNFENGILEETDLEDINCMYIVSTDKRFYKNQKSNLVRIVLNRFWMLYFAKLIEYESFYHTKYQ